MLGRLRRWAAAFKREVLAVWIAGRDPRTPLAARLAAVMVAAYALSPIDLIPDFIPVLGYLDDLLIVPLGIALVIRLVPPDLMHACREEAARREGRPRSMAGAAVILLLWLLAIWVAGRWLMPGTR